MARAALLSTMVVILGCGCSDVIDVHEPSQACAGEPTRPLTAAELSRALRGHGFTVYPIPDDAICDLPPSERIPVSLGNVLFEGPHENIEQHNQITEREGHVFCGLRRTPIWGMDLKEDLNAPPASPIFSGDKAEFKFANLECTIYPDGGKSDEQIRKLQLVVRELASLARQKIARRLEPRRKPNLAWASVRECPPTGSLLRRWRARQALSHANSASRTTASAAPARTAPRRLPFASSTSVVIAPTVTSAMTAGPMVSAAIATSAPPFSERIRMIVRKPASSPIAIPAPTAKTFSPSFLIGDSYRQERHGTARPSAYSFRDVAGQRKIACASVRECHPKGLRSRTRNSSPSGTASASLTRTEIQGGIACEVTSRVKCAATPISANLSLAPHTPSCFPQPNCEE
jgi:hypothetical protein